MATKTKSAISGKEKKVFVPKTTSQGASKFTRFRSKNDKRLRKAYRGQGR